jgi:hypothetical protein
VLDVRVLDGGALLCAGRAQAGDVLSLGARGSIAVCAVSSWAQFRASRDPGFPLVLLGFGLVVAGAFALFVLVRVDTAVIVTPVAEGRERVTVALRAQRFAPLFAARFEALAREHLGEPPGKGGPSTPDEPPGGKPRRPAGLAHGALAWAVPLLVWVASGCGPRGGLPAVRAERLVRTYNQRLIEAYRTSDPGLIEGVAGPDECRKILGLIGVKSDQGLSLDATLVSLAVWAIKPLADGAVTVTTDEVWRYADRRIGSGEVVGESSEDSYRMAYRLERSAGRGWVVAQVRFAAPPRVGRAAVTDQVPVSAHSIGAPDGRGGRGEPAARRAAPRSP